jgi:hypothetical protein
MSQFANCRTFPLLLIALAIAAVPIGSARAADDERVTELERRANDSARLIEELTRRIHELEARLQPNAQVAEVASTEDPAQRLATVEQEVRQIVEANASSSESNGLPVHGFADVGAGTRNPTNPDKQGFTVGTLDFYLTPDLGERTRALLELVFEVDQSGALATDLERLQFGYEIGEGSTIWVGRFHTPYGYYNNAFHHGQQISTSLRRPRFLMFEDQGGILPAHTVGTWWTGARQLDSGKLTYDLYVGNAQRIIDGTLDLGAAGVDHADAIVGGNMGFLPGGRFEGLRAGVSYFTASVEDDALATNRTHVNNYGIYAVYSSDRWENMAELHFFDDREQTGAAGTHRSNAWFAQFAYRLDRLMPYVRYEQADLEQADPFFSAQTSGGSYNRVALGLRFDLELTSTVKLEFARTNNTDRLQEEYSEALMQYAIRF